MFGSSAGLHACDVRGSGVQQSTVVAVVSVDASKSCDASKLDHVWQLYAAQHCGEC